MAHTQDGEAAMVVALPVAMDVTRHAPLENDPQVEDQESHAHIQQTQGWIGGSGACSDAIHLTITGSNAKGCKSQIVSLYLTKGSHLHIVGS